MLSRCQDGSTHASVPRAAMRMGSLFTGLLGMSVHLCDMPARSASQRSDVDVVGSGPQTLGGLHQLDNSLKPSLATL